MLVEATNVNDINKQYTFHLKHAKKRRAIF